MAWIEQQLNDFTIATGDGASYRVKWRAAGKAVEYNVATFEFPNLSGTLVKRSRPKGVRYALEFYFDGDNHLADALSFQTSSENPAPWVLSHPQYGTLTVQPVSLSFDNSVDNITKVTGTVIETIAEGEPVVRVAPEDKIATDKEATDVLLAETYATQVQPTTRDIEDIKDNNTKIYEEGRKSLTTNLDTENYINAFNTAESFVNDATSEPLAAMRKTQALLNAPVQFASNVRARLDVLADQFTQLRNTLANISTRAQKKLYENQGGTIIGALALTTVTNFARSSDYSNRTVVLGVIDTLLDNYNTFIADLDSLQSLNGGAPDNYIPDFDGVFALGALISFTVGNLFRIAGNSRQERVIFTDRNTNAIKLADQLYGIASDENIQLVMDSNNIGLNELFVIQKNRRIIYYV